MPKDKERTLNPAAAQRKAEKQRALKKSKAAVTAQRNERLAHRNPDRLQRQIDELKDLEQSRGQLSQREKSSLADLERDVIRIRKAREVIGDKTLNHPSDDHKFHKSEDSVLGKRGRTSHQQKSEKGISARTRARSWSSSATDDDVRGIPMPRDTPPPIPSRRRQNGRSDGRVMSENKAKSSGDTSFTAPTVSSHLVYESKPVLRDLQKEATGFVPGVVKRKMDAVRGGVNSRLMEEEEMEKLEQEGYVRDAKHERETGETGGDAAKISDDQIQQEIKRFHRDMMHVQIEEVEDEDA